MADPRIGVYFTPSDLFQAALSPVSSQPFRRSIANNNSSLQAMTGSVTVTYWHGAACNCCYVRQTAYRPGRTSRGRGEVLRRKGPIEPTTIQLDYSTSMELGHAEVLGNSTQNGASPMTRY